MLHKLKVVLHTRLVLKYFFVICKSISELFRAMKYNVPLYHFKVIVLPRVYGLIL